MLETLAPPAAPTTNRTAAEPAGDQPVAAWRAAGAYAAPQLVVYGSLRAITARVGSKGMRDGSGSRKTGF